MAPGRELPPSHKRLGEETVGTEGRRGERAGQLRPAQQEEHLRYDLWPVPFEKGGLGLAATGLGY